MRRFEPHSTAMSPSAFPAELYDKIIDELAPSKDELSVCSLVSHSWAPRSRTHMFRNVNYTACPSPEKTSSKRAEDFQRYLANSTIASYARHLSLTLTNSDKNAEIPHASRLVNLQSLTIHGSNTIIYSVNDRALTRLLSFIRHNANLERFSLESVVIDPSAFDVFIGCIAIRAPRLQSLHLNSIVGPDWITDAWNRRRAAARTI
ncbi:hypothetical protein BT96DRAFT_617916 [Gymnopus androsaceus JB14]|uniref:F-box domain-containing protein n=1 Tax=Gymnopus androsaceus JB14 TaxID=1447944 RepID=A0A6A4HSI3_9AGAR|nr:hypothetical protein BT96DRAFT_617916 [Gymnopus androsaceus JB14]